MTTIGQCGLVPVRRDSLRTRYETTVMMVTATTSNNWNGNSGIPPPLFVPPEPELLVDAVEDTLVVDSDLAVGEVVDVEVVVAEPLRNVAK